MDVAQEKFNEGLIEFKQGNFGQAFALFTEATQWDSDFAEAFYHLGILYDHQEDKDMASRYYQMTLAANPDHYGAKVQLNLVDENAGPEKPVVPLSDQDFFVRLREESGDAAENLLAPKLNVRGQLALMWLNIIAKFLIMLVPSLLTGVFVGSAISAMGFGDMLMNIVIITLVFYLITWVQKQGYW
jgi:tetratricopeptide (TPR) repeat protein